MNSGNQGESAAADALTVEIRGSLDEVDRDAWNALNTDGNPFVTYEFLHGLEATDCLGADKGWYPRYFLVWQNYSDAASSDADNADMQGKQSGNLVAAMPAYVKTHSYGEFVFDWAWADAYSRHGEDYYPKLVCAIPFTPATGPRIYVHPSQPFDEIVKLLSTAACQYAVEQEFSSVHWLFTRAEECALLCGESARSVPHDQATDEAVPQEVDAPVLPILQRIDCQYHWHNDNYQSFDDFLQRCTAKRRKTLRRERRFVTDAGLTLERREGATLTAQEWGWVHQFYCATFDSKWGSPSLTEAFFCRMGDTFGKNTLIVFAYDPADAEPDKPVACSIMFLGGNRLFGRFWGCRRDYHCLHFEACYYQGIEHCIENDISFFEPGAQGEHKITRGFVPTVTESAHFIAHPGFRDAISNYLKEEKKHALQRCAGLSDLLPFKHELQSLGTDANSVHST